MDENGFVGEECALNEVESVDTPVGDSFRYRQLDEEVQVRDTGYGSVQSPEESDLDSTLPLIGEPSPLFLGIQSEVVIQTEGNEEPDTDSSVPGTSGDVGNTVGPTDNIGDAASAGPSGSSGSLALDLGDLLNGSGAGTPPPPPPPSTPPPVVKGVSPLLSNSPLINPLIMTAQMLSTKTITPPDTTSVASLERFYLDVEHQAESLTPIIDGEVAAARQVRVDKESIAQFFYLLNNCDERSLSIARVYKDCDNWEELKGVLRSNASKTQDSDSVQVHLSNILRTRCTNVNILEGVWSHYDRELDNFFAVLATSSFVEENDATLIKLPALRALMFQSVMGMYMPRDVFKTLCDNVNKGTKNIQFGMSLNKAYAAKGKQRQLNQVEYIDGRGDVIARNQVNHVSQKPGNQVNQNKAQPKSQPSGGKQGGNKGSGNGNTSGNSDQRGNGRKNPEYELPKGACVTCASKSCKNKGNCGIMYCGRHDIFDSHVFADCSMGTSPPAGGRGPPPARGRGGGRGSGQGRGRGGGGGYPSQRGQYYQYGSDGPSDYQSQQYRVGNVQHSQGQSHSNFYPRDQSQGQTSPQGQASDGQTGSSPQNF